MIEVQVVARVVVIKMIICSIFDSFDSFLHSNIIIIFRLQTTHSTQLDSFPNAISIIKTFIYDSIKDSIGCAHCLCIQFY